MPRRSQSTHARLSANKFYKAIVAFSIPPKNQRKHELHQYINLFKHYVQSFNEYALEAKRMTDEDMLVHFRNVVDKVPEFDVTTGNLEKDEINGIEYTSQQVIQQYENTALRADGRTSPRAILPSVPSAPSDALRRLSVNIHDSYVDSESGSFNMDDAFSSILDDAYNNTYDVNATDRGGNGTSRMPNRLWNMMSRNDQKGWLSISQEGRRAIAAVLEAYQDTTDRGDSQGDNNSSTRSQSSRPQNSSTSSRSISRTNTSSTSRDTRRVNFHDADVPQEAEEIDVNQDTDGEPYLINNCSLIDTIESPLSRDLIANKSITVEPPSDPKG